MNKNIFLTLLTLSLSVLSASAQQKSYQQYTKNLPFKMEEVKAPGYEQHEQGDSIYVTEVVNTPAKKHFN